MCRTDIRVPQQFGKFNVRDTPRGLGAKGVAGAIEHQMLASFDVNLGALSYPRHLSAKGVLGVGGSVGIQEDVIRRLMVLLSKPFAQLQDWQRQRYDTWSWIALPSHRFVVLQNPKAGFQVDPIPNKGADFYRSATCPPKGQQNTAKADITVTQEILELSGGDDPSPGEAREVFRIRPVGFLSKDHGGWPNQRPTEKRRSCHEW